MLQYIVRMEHPATGKGPFSDKESFKLLPTSMPAFPIRWELLEDFTRLHVCGCEYISQLYEWLGNDFAPFLAIGFKVYLYLVPRHKVLFAPSGTQLAFNPDDAIEKEVLYAGGI